MTNPKLAQIPRDLLLRKATPAGRATLTRKLLRWCELNHYRPMLADLEAERTRRGGKHRTTTKGSNHE